MPRRGTPARRARIRESFAGICAWDPPPWFAAVPARRREPRVMADLASARIFVAPPAPSGHRRFQVLVHLVEEPCGGEPFLVGADQEREVLGHVAGLDGVDRDLLQGRREL